MATACVVEASLAFVRVCWEAFAVFGNVLVVRARRALQAFAHNAL